MGATVGAIVALLVCSGDQKVSTKIAFTSFENNTGWNNSTPSNCVRSHLGHLPDAPQTAGRSCYHSQPRCGRSLAVSGVIGFLSYPYSALRPDDSAAHISEEVSGAARAAPIAILVSCAAVGGLGWILIIAASFATVSVSALLETELALPMGQLLLDVLGKRGMLAVWSFVIIAQVCAYIERY